MVFGSFYNGSPCIRRCWSCRTDTLCDALYLFLCAKLNSCFSSLRFKFCTRTRLSAFMQAHIVFFTPLSGHQSVLFKKYHPTSPSKFPIRGCVRTLLWFMISWLVIKVNKALWEYTRKLHAFELVIKKWLRLNSLTTAWILLRHSQSSLLPTLCTP